MTSFLFEDRRRYAAFWVKPGDRNPVQATTSTTNLDIALDKLKENSGKPVALLIGPDVAAFLLRFGANLLA